MFLIGFSGSGKTTVGPLLAARMKLPFNDLDSVIEKQSGRLVTDIFADSGEKVFRRMELTELKRLLSSGRGGVVALGGGAYENESIRDTAMNYGYTVYLSCSARELYRRLRTSEDRPLLRVTSRQGETVRQARMRRIKTLVKKRLANYCRADFIVSTTKRTPSQVVRHLQKILSEFE